MLRLRVHGRRRDDGRHVSCRRSGGHRTLRSSPTASRPVSSRVWSRSQSGAQIAGAIHNAGGLRSTIAGPNITQGDVLALAPFGNQLVEMTFTGDQLWDIFEGVASEKNSAGLVRLLLFLGLLPDLKLIYASLDCLGHQPDPGLEGDQVHLEPERDCRRPPDLPRDQRHVGPAHDQLYNRHARLHRHR
jgi:hypothetical protein